MSIPADRLTADDLINVNGREVFVVRKQDSDPRNPFIGLVVTEAFTQMNLQCITVRRTDRFTLIAA